MSDSRKGSSSGRGSRKGSSSPEESVERRDRDRVDSPSYSQESETESYALQCFFDPQEDCFEASFLEFPDLRVREHSRLDAIEVAEDKLHSHLAALRQSGNPVPPPANRRDYPSKIEISVSKALYRKLENLRHQERVSMEQLIAEVLTAATEKKADLSPRPNQKDRRHHGSSQNQSRQGNRSNRGRNYHDTMGSRENFLEYVRNLEKGGGYKKR